MPATTVHDSSVVLLGRALETLKGLLTKAEAHAAAGGVDPDTFASARLAPDMLPLSFQVQTVCNTTKKCLERLTGRSLQSFADDEKTIAQLKQRVDQTIELVKAVKPEEINGNEDARVEINMGKAGSLDVTRVGMVYGYSIPNAFFHLNMAYAILRAQGVPLAKADYLGSFLLPQKLD